MSGDEFVLVDGSTFFVSSPDGDVHLERHGLFHADVRHLSTWELRIDGEPLEPLTTRLLTYYRAYLAGTRSRRSIGDNSTLSVHRLRVLGGGCGEVIEFENHSDFDADITVELRFWSDFATIFDVKAARKVDDRSECEISERTATLLSAELRRATILTFDTAAVLGRGSARWELNLPPRAQRRLYVELSHVVGDDIVAPRHDRETGAVHPLMAMSLEEWTERAPRLSSDSASLCTTYEQSLCDLAALRYRPLPGLEHSLPAGGRPWFMALFGRDSVIAAYESLPYHPSLAAATLRALAAWQADHDDPTRDAEPGKILHELRHPDVTRRSTSTATPPYPYFGSHDATPLFVVLLDEYHCWTGDSDLVRELEGAARAALSWIERHGDLDGDGYLEYRRRAPHGIDNQCWKDSWNSMRFADGRFAHPPIATCEIQAYAFDARRRAARLARECWDDPGLARHLESDADRLYDRFNRDFFDEERGRYVLALDRDKRRVDALASNVGHLLWTGIVPAERCDLVAEQLVSRGLFTGWGIRTMAATEGAYNPMEYHNGCVWPHDTALAAEGLRRYGRRREARVVVSALLDAAREFAGQLPEVFAGFDRDHTLVPVEYATASRPQAIAAGAPLLLLRTILGLDPSGEGPPGCGTPPNVAAIRLDDVEVRGERRSFSAEDADAVDLLEQV